MRRPSASGCPPYASGLSRKSPTRLLALRRDLVLHLAVDALPDPGPRALDLQGEVEPDVEAGVGADEGDPEVAVLLVAGDRVVRDAVLADLLAVGLPAFLGDDPLDLL